MPRTPPGRQALLIPGIVCVALALAAVMPLSPWVPPDDAWTAVEQARPLTEEHARVEVMLDGRSLELAVAQGALQRQDGRPLDAHDFLVRFNETDQLREVRLAIFAALAAAGAVLLILALMSPARRSRRTRDE